MWNSLPNEIKASPNKHRFKTAVKKYFSNVSPEAEQHMYAYTVVLLCLLLLY